MDGCLYINYRIILWLANNSLTPHVAIKKHSTFFRVALFYLPPKRIKRSAVRFCFDRHGLLAHIDSFLFWYMLSFSLIVKTILVVRYSRGFSIAFTIQLLCPVFARHEYIVHP